MAKTYGPYLYKDGTRRLTIKRDDGTTTTKSYAKALLEEKLGRALVGDETADHIDERAGNDDPTNLQVLTRAENAKKWHLARGTKIEMTAFVCPQCGQPAEKPARYVRHNRKQGKAGPFCGRSCARRYSSGVGVMVATLVLETSAKA